MPISKGRDLTAVLAGVGELLSSCWQAASQTLASKKERPMRERHRRPRYLPASVKAV
jgi:hypothetical protein